MTPLLWRSSGRYARRHPWQLALAVLGIGAGVAVVLGIDLANESARRAFRLSGEAVAGRATHVVVGGPSGIPEELYVRLRTAGWGPAAPVVEGWVISAGDDRPLRLLGVDPLAEAPFRPYLGVGGASTTPAAPAPAGTTPPLAPLLTVPGGVVLTPDTATRLGVEPDVPLEVGVSGIARRARVVGLLHPDDALGREALRDVLVADVSVAQELLGREGRLDRIELRLPAGPSSAQLQRLQRLLPPGARVEPAGAPTRTRDQMLEAFRVNLSALGLLALICGAFLIYNTMTFSVVQRREQIGALRALGVTRREVFGTVIAEAALVGIAGTALGLGLGAALGRGLLDLVTRTINDLYFVVTVSRFSVDPASVAKAIGLGIGASVVASLVPAREATAAPPRATLTRSTLETGWRRRAPRLAAVGGVVAALGGVVLALSGDALGPTFAGLFGVVLGCALATPAATVATMSIARPVLGQFAGLVGAMAARGVVTTLSRTAVATAALVVALSVIVGVGVMVDSFRGTVASWLETSLQADLYVAAPGPPGTPGDLGIGPDFVERVDALPGVLGVSTVHRVTVEGPGGATRLVAFDLDPRSRAGFDFAAGRPSRAWPAFDAGAVLLTEPLAYRAGLGPGDEILLHTDHGPHRFPVAGVYYDYVSDRGAVIMSRPTFERHFDDRRYSGISLHVAETWDLDDVADRVRDLLGVDRVATIRSNRALRRASMEVFDRTFLITRVLQALVAAVAFIGVFAALMALQLERRREMGVLRAVGLTPGQLRGLLSGQSALMGLAAAALALPLGTLLAALMVFVVNRRSFGWTLRLRVDPEILGLALLVGVVAAALAGLYPAVRMARTLPARALQEE